MKLVRNRSRYLDDCGRGASVVWVRVTSGHEMQNYFACLYSGKMRHKQEANCVSKERAVR